VASLSPAVPFFAARLQPRELCTEETNGEKEIAVRCIVGRGQMKRLVVQNGRHDLIVREEGKPARSWTMNGFPDVCFDLHPYGAHRDLEPLRAAWGLDADRIPCRNGPNVSPVRVVVELQPVPDAGPSFCNGKSGLTNAAAVRLLVPGSHAAQDLGVLGNLCGGLHVTRYDDVEALGLGTSDMGTEQRFAYRLGDRLYFVTADDRFGSVELPCGAKVAFDVRSTPATGARITTCR